MSHADRSPRRWFLPTRILILVVLATLVSALATISTPTDVLGATVSKTTLCRVNVRTGATTGAHVKALMPSGTKVSVVATVTGGRYRMTCAGASVSARTWYRISAIAGKSVRSLYGVPYVYGASSAFKPTPFTRYAACATSLRTRAAGSATAKVQIKTDTKVLVATSVKGGAWSKTCAGRSISGSAWYRISMIGGRTVRALYGVSSLYAPGGSFKTTVSAAPTTPLPPPAPTTPGTTINVSSIPALLTALADNSVDTIVVADGTYHISRSGDQKSDSLWIGARFAARTRPITVRAATRGGVTFDGGGVSYFGCISFNGGAHDQTWDGFNCAGGQATSTGIVTFGGYDGVAAPHHITMRNITILATCTGRATTAASSTLDHAFYLSYAVGGPHDLLFEDITVDGAGHLASAFHFFHSNSTNQNAWNVTVRRLHVSGTQQAVILWDPTLRNITFDTADIRNALAIAVRYESPGATGIVFENITSSGSGKAGFYSTLGAHPAGVTFSNNTFN